jgi:WD40 repeat protein
MWSPELLQLQGHDGLVLSVAFSPDGSKIISGSSDKTIRVWDASTGVECSHPFEAMMTRFILSHSRLMDPKSSRGQMTRPFEFGMQALVSRCSHPFEAMMARFLLSHSRPMDPKSSRGLMTRPFEFGMQAQASRCSHPFEAMMTGFVLSHSRLMDPKSSRGQTDKTIRVWDASTGVEMLPPLRGHDITGFFCRILARWIQNHLWVR